MPPRHTVFEYLIENCHLIKHTQRVCPLTTVISPVTSLLLRRIVWSLTNGVGVCTNKLKWPYKTCYLLIASLRTCKFNLCMGHCIDLLCSCIKYYEIQVISFIECIGLVYNGTHILRKCRCGLCNRYHTAANCNTSSGWNRGHLMTPSIITLSKDV